MKITINERFYRKVKVLSEDDCWEWQAGADKNGYGCFWFTKRWELAHRVAYILANDLTLDDIKDQLILHSCDNPSCCNPKHLREGTHADNTQDCIERGRCYTGKQYGEYNPMSKITESDVREIRERIASGETQRSIAPLFGVTYKAISKIHTRRTWAHV